MLAEPRRAVRGARRGIPGVRLDGEGPAGGARRTSWRRRCGVLAPVGLAVARPPRARHRRARRSRTSTRCASSATGRAAGWDSRWPKRRTRRGADVTLVAGPTIGGRARRSQQVVRVRSAAEMHEAVMARAAEADVVIMAAAVADYTPQGKRAARRWPKGDGPLSLTLTRTKDILADLGAMRDAMGGRRPVLVGFAAETERRGAQGARQARAQARRPDRGQRRVAGRSRLRRRHQRRDAGRRDGRGGGAAAGQGRRGRRPSWTPWSRWSTQLAQAVAS